MSKELDAIRSVAEAHGYELARSDESWGDKFFGLFVFIKMSDRKLDPDKDYHALARGADLIKEGLETVSAQLDPEGPKMRQEYREQIERIYENAGVKAIFMEPLPNGYCPRPCCLNKPWFRVTSSIGHIVIGWRRSVMSIEWKDTTLPEKNAEKLFPDENVTRWETGMHSYGTENAARYIKKLHE